MDPVPAHRIRGCRLGQSRFLNRASENPCLKFTPPSGIRDSHFGAVFCNQPSGDGQALQGKRLCEAGIRERMCFVFLGDDGPDPVLNPVLLFQPLHEEVAKREDTEGTLQEFVFYGTGKQGLFDL